MMDSTEMAVPAEESITAAVTTQGVAEGDLNVHVDGGTSMTSKGAASYSPTSAWRELTTVSTWATTTRSPLRVSEQDH